MRKEWIGWMERVKGMGEYEYGIVMIYNMRTCGGELEDAYT